MIKKNNDSLISVKLPELLQSTDISSKKLKVLLKYLDMFLRYVMNYNKMTFFIIKCHNLIKELIMQYVYSYLEMHREWFGEQFYMQMENRTSQTSNV